MMRWIFAFIHHLILSLVEIEIENYSAFTLSDTCKIMFIVPSTCSPESTCEDYSPDNNISADGISDSFLGSFWRGPLSINGILYVKRNRFLLVFIINTSTSDFFHSVSSVQFPVSIHVDIYFYYCYSTLAFTGVIYIFTLFLCVFPLYQIL